MHGKDFLVDDGGDRQTVETVCKRLPQFDVIPSFTLIVKAVYTVDRCTFVVTAENEEVFGIFDLVG